MLVCEHLCLMCRVNELERIAAGDSFMLSYEPDVKKIERRCVQIFTSNGAATISFSVNACVSAFVLDV